MSHFTYKHRGKVDSQLLMVANQIANLTHGFFFCHKLCCICSNGSLNPFSTSTLRNLSNDIEKTSMQGVLTPTIELGSFGSPRRLPSPHFGSGLSSSHSSKSGVATLTFTLLLLIFILLIFAFTPLFFYFSAIVFYFALLLNGFMLLFLASTIIVCFHIVGSAFVLLLLAFV